MEGVASPPRRAVAPLEWAALAATIVPVVVAVVRAALRHWMPVGDAAYFTVRSRDVLTEHWPLVGAWSSGSAVVDTPVNNLGPLQLDLLAPFTKPAPYLGTAVGSAAINGAALWAVWFSARRLLGPRGVAVVMAATLLLASTLGLSWLIDARQQYALALPFLALLWLAAAMWAGSAAAVPLGLGAASLLAQTHFTYLYQATVVAAAGVAAYAVGAVRVRDARRRRVAGWSAAVLAACWAQPAIDQFAGTGNLGDVLGGAGGEPGVGWASGIQIVAGGSLVPPFWLPGSLGGFLLPHDGVTLAGAALATSLWLTAAGAVAWLGWRLRLAAPAALGGSAAVAGVAGLLAAAQIPVSMFGLVPQNYYWVWPLGAFVTTAVVVGTAVVVARRAVGWLDARWLTVAATASLAAVTALAVWPRYPVDSVVYDEAEAQRVGRPLRAGLARAFAAPAFPAVVEVDLSRAFFANNYPYVLLAELQRAGVEFRFPPGSRNLARFGESLCAAAGSLDRVLLVVGHDPPLDEGSRVIASVDGFGPARRAELAALRGRFGNLLRDGAVTVDVAAVTDVLDDDLARVEAIIATPGEPASGVAEQLAAWRRWGYVEVPADVQDEFGRWVDLERRAVTDYQTVLLAPPGTGTQPVESDAQTC